MYQRWSLLRSDSATYKGISGFKEIRDKEIVDAAGLPGKTKRYTIQKFHLFLRVQ
jgi:hypothetical protein